MNGTDLKHLEDKLWEAADQLRANSKLTATEYSFPVLGLISLRHAWRRFKDARSDIEDRLPVHPQRGRRAIVCAMWITGFDVPDLSTMYIDKPLKTHTLMQTIARANRVHEDNNNGLIVDYIETYKALLEALAIYAVGSTKAGDGAAEAPVRPKEELVKELSEAISATETYLQDEVCFKLATIIESEGLMKIAAIRNGVDAVYTNDETKNRFSVLAREVFKKYKAVSPERAIYPFKPRRDAINALYSVITGNVEEADVSAIVKHIQGLVDASIESLDIISEPTEDHGKKIDLSGLDFERIEEEFLSTTRKNTTVQMLKQAVGSKLNQLLNQNPLGISFYERYQEIIEAYNRGKEYASIKEIFDKLKDLYKDLSQEEKRAFIENLS